jgi:hypothetical protein
MTPIVPFLPSVFCGDYAWIFNIKPPSLFVNRSHPKKTSTRSSQSEARPGSDVVCRIDGLAKLSDIVIALLTVKVPIYL